jgi:outer membrane protein
MHFARRHLSVLALAAASLLPATLLESSAFADSTQNQARFAVIDTRRALMETEEGLRVQANLKKLFDQRQVELSENEQKLSQEQEDIAKEEKAKGPSAAIEQKKEAWRQKAAALQETLLNYQREMQRKEAEMTNPMLQKLLGIVKRVATQDGYDMVVDKQAVPYSRSDLDITDKIIQLYNAEGGTGVQDKQPAQKPATPPPGDAKKPAAPAPAPAKDPAKK